MSGSISAIVGLNPESRLLNSESRCIRWLYSIRCAELQNLVKRMPELGDSFTTVKTKQGFGP